MKLLKRLIRYIFPYKKNIILIFLSNLFYSVFSIFSLTMIAPFLSVLFGQVEKLAQKPAFSFSVNTIIDTFYYYMGVIIDDYGKAYALVYIAVTMIVLSFFSNLFRYLALYFLAPIRTGFIRDLRRDIYKRLIILPLSFFSHYQKGDIMNRIGADVQEVEWSIVCALQMLFRDPLLVIIYFITLMVISPKLTLIVLLVLPIAGYIIALIGKSIKRNSVKAQQILGKMSSIFEEAIGGLRIIKGYNAIDFASEKFRKENQEFYRLNKKIFRKTELGPPMIELMAVLALMFVLFIGSSFVLTESGLKAEIFMLYIVVFSRIIPPAQSLVSSVYTIQKGMASAQRIYEIVDADEKIMEAENPLPLTDFKDKIEYRNVSFSYQEKESTEVLKNISFVLEKGKTVALVGASGGGKSTLVDLLPRFYDIREGEILIDGVSSKLFKISDLREVFGVVNQDITLFNETVFNNIAFGKKEVTRDMVISAAKIANAHNFIMEMENGYDTLIGDRGMKLSGGQRQRLSIARAVLKNPQVLILDEATSALDTESEFLVQEALQQLMQNRTAIVIAHRLSTIRHADRILFIENGEIVESGTHQELMEKKGAYRKFCSIQGTI